MVKTVVLEVKKFDLFAKFMGCFRGSNDKAVKDFF